jgi:hypothetical protein
MISDASNVISNTWVYDCIKQSVAEYFISFAFFSPLVFTFQHLFYLILMSNF